MWIDEKFLRRRFMGKRFTSYFVIQTISRNFLIEKLGNEHERLLYLSDNITKISRGTQQTHSALSRRHVWRKSIKTLVERVVCLFVGRFHVIFSRSKCRKMACQPISRNCDVIMSAKQTSAKCRKLTPAIWSPTEQDNNSKAKDKVWNYWIHDLFREISLSNWIL